MSSNPCNMAIFQFFSMAAAAIVDFIIFKLLTVGTFKKVKLHQCAKFRWNRSNRNRDFSYRDFSIVQRWRPPPPWILKFQIFNGVAVKRVERRHHTKFRWNRPKRGRDIAIYRFFKMAAVAILDLKNFKLLTVGRSRGPNCIIVPNFVKIGQTAAEIWRFLDSSYHIISPNLLWR